MSEQHEQTGEAPETPANQAADALIKLLESGQRPSPEKAAKLLTLLQTNDGPEADTAGTIGDETAGAALDAIEEEPSLEERVKAAITEALTKNPKPQTRGINHIFPKYKVSQSDKEAGLIVQRLLIEKLQEGADLLTIARYCTFLHDFPREVGGGGFSNMSEAPEAKKLILERLSKEIDQYGDNPMHESQSTDNAFYYLYARITNNLMPSDWKKIKGWLGRFDIEEGGTQKETLKNCLRYMLDKMV